MASGLLLVGFQSDPAQPRLGFGESAFAAPAREKGRVEEGAGRRDFGCGIRH